MFVLAFLKSIFNADSYIIFSNTAAFEKIKDKLILKSKKLGALEIPRRSPIQVLIEPSSA